LNFSAWSIRNPVPSILLFILLSVGGLLAFDRLPVQNFPDMDLPTVKVSASLEGASPSQLETEVARKIEDKLASLSLLDHITTTITDGTVAINVSFQLEKDSEEALNEVRNAVDSASGDLPSQMQTPGVTKVTVQGSPLITYAVRSSRLNETELSWFVDNDMTKALLAVSGVGEVSRLGGIDREVHIDLNPQVMSSLGISAATVSAQLKSVQSDTSGGRAEIGGSKQSIRTLGAVSSIEDLKALAIPLLTARVRGIHAQNRKAPAGLAGQRCALNLAGEHVTKDGVRRGDIVLAPALHAPTDRIDAVLCVLGSETKPVGTWLPARLHSHAVQAGARIVPLAGPLTPGGRGLVQLVLDRPIAATIGDRFILRDTSASRTIGGGRFLDLRPPSRKRGTPERLTSLAAARAADPAQALAGLIDVVPVELAIFLRDRALAESALPGILAAAKAETVGGFALSSTAFHDLQRELAEQLTTFHAENPDLAGMGREQLRLALCLRLPKETFLAFLKMQAAAGGVVLDGAFLGLPGHELRLSPADERLWLRLHPELLGENRFRPPRVRDIADVCGMEEREVRRVLKLTQKLGRTDQIAHDHFFAREVTEEMAALVRDVAAKAPDGWFTAPSFRDRVHNGRKVAIEILDFFDRLGLTLRKGDLRHINPHRSDLFGD
jgi:hypothetical protein